MRIAVIGAGGVGGYFGGRLAEAGHDVNFIARGAHLEAMRRDGLIVQSPVGDFSVRPAQATDDPAGIGAVDVVLLCVKTYQLGPAIAVVSPLVGAETAVLTVQNGVEAPDHVAEAVGREHVFPGIAKIFSSVAGPGRIRHLGGPTSLAFAEWDNRPSARVDRLRAALGEAGAAVVIPDDIWTELWSKFLFVVPFGALGTAADAPIGALRSNPGTRQLLQEAMREIEAVAQARGVVLPPDIVETTMVFVDGLADGGTSSLQRDIHAGHPSELDAWSGAVVRLGTQIGVATPVHRVIHDVVSLLADQRKLRLDR